MVIEAKFTVPDPAVYWSLQTRDHLAGYSLSTTQVKHVWDTYLDTKRHRILAAGCSCQRSLTREGIVITLKSLGRAEGAVHRRRKCELSMATNRPVADWPDSPVRDLVLQLIGQEALLTFFELRQTRVIRMLKEDDQPVANVKPGQRVAGHRRYRTSLSGIGGGVAATNPERNIDDDRRLFAGCLESEF